MKNSISFLLLVICYFQNALSQVNFISSNLPILVITTNEAIPDEPKITGDLGIIWQPDGSRNYVADAFNHYDGKIGIELRGSSSQWFPKKGYAIETRQEDGTNNNVEILGMPKENDWVLHGPFSDKSLIRNGLAYILAGEIMEYAPRVRFCEVLINGDYQGVYLLTEKVKRDKNRVDIDKLQPEDQDGDAITGGYILKFDKATSSNNGSFLSNYSPENGAWQQTAFLFHYPKISDRSEAQNDYITNYIHNFETLLKSPDFADPQTGYQNFLDIPSFIDFMWIQEIGRNVDGYRLSTYFYKERDSEGGKLKFGPIWDFNLAFGNVNYCIGGGHEGWAWNFNNACPDDAWIIHFWWNKIRGDQSFRTAAKTRWEALRQHQLSDKNVQHKIDSLRSLLAESANRNFQQWPILNEYVWPNYVVEGSWQQEIDYLQDWLQNRLIWMDKQMENFAQPIYRETDYFPPKVVPNPSASNFTFNYYIRDFNRVEIYIYNTTGQLIRKLEDFDHTNGRNSVTWESFNAPTGIYFYEMLLDGRRVINGKLLKE